MKPSFPEFPSLYGSRRDLGGKSEATAVLRSEAPVGTRHLGRQHMLLDLPAYLVSVGLQVLD